MSGIPGTTISSIAQSQLAHAASFQSYGNFISDQYGTRVTPPSQASVSGGGSTAGVDPRYNPMVQPYALQTSLASSIMGAGRSGLDMGLGGVSTAAAFGVGPRAFDPFTATLGMMGSGYRWGGAAGAIGYGAASAGMYAAGGAVMNAGMGQIMGGGQDQAQLSGMFGNVWNRQNMPMMGGSGPSFGQQTQFGNMMSGMASSDPSLSMGSLTGLMGQGAMGGSFRGTTSFGDFAGKFKQLVSEVKTVAETFNSSLSEAYGVMQQIQGMGFYRPGAAGSAGQTISGLASAVGMQAGDMMSAAGMGADLWTQTGGSRSSGAQVMTGVTAQLSSLTGSGALDGDRIRDMFGGAGLSQALPSLAGRLSQYSSRFGGTRYGQQILGAMMDPTTGHIDRSRAGGLGDMGWDDIQAQYRKNMGVRGARHSLQTGTAQLSREMTEMLGPQWAAQGLGAMSEARGGGVGATEKYMAMVESGIPQEELDIMNNLASFGPELNAFLKVRGQQAIRQGIEDSKGSTSGSWQLMKQRLKQAFVEPFTRPLRKFGREVMGGLQGWTGDIIDDFMGTSPGLIRDGRLDSSFSAGSAGLTGTFAGSGTGPGEAQVPGLGGGLGGAVSSWLPGGLTNVLTGGGFGGAGGMALSGWNAGVSGITAASMPMLGGSNAIGALGRGMTGLGAAAWGAGGSAGKVLGALGTGGGWGMRALGGAAKFAGPAMMAADLAFNTGPAAYRGESFGGFRPADLWGGQALMGPGGGMGNFGERMAEMHAADPSGAQNYYGLAQHFIDQTPGLQSLGGSGGTTSKMYLDAADPAQRGLRTLGFSSGAEAQGAATAYYGALTDPGGAFSERLSRDEQSRFRAVFGTVDPSVRGNDTLLEHSISRGRRAYGKLGTTGMDADIRAKMDSGDPMQMLAAFGVGGGHFEKLVEGAKEMSPQQSLRGRREGAIGALLGPGSEKDPGDFSDLVRGQGNTPGIFLDAMSYAQATTGKAKARIGASAYGKYQGGSEGYLPEGLREGMGEGMLSQGEFLNRLSGASGYFHAEIQDKITRDAGTMSQTNQYISRRGLGTQLGMLGSRLPETVLRGRTPGDAMSQMMIASAGPWGVGDATTQDLTPQYPDFKSALSDTYSAFEGMSRKERGTLAQMAYSEDETMLPETRLFAARAGVYNKTEQDYARASGREKTQLAILHNAKENETFISGKNVGGFLKNLLTGTGGESGLARIQQSLPTLAAGKTSFEFMDATRQAIVDAGLGGDPSRGIPGLQDVLLPALAAKDGKVEITEEEARKVMRTHTDLKTYKAMGGGTGPGGAGAGNTMDAFVTTVGEATAKLQKIIETLPEGK
jgi:hypothetical protein